MARPGLYPAALRYANLALLCLWPIAWSAPLLRAGWLPFFELEEISVLSGLQALWRKDVILALVVTFLALFAPLVKSLGLALVHFDLASDRVLAGLSFLGRLAMADVFLIALYIVLAQGAMIGRLQTAWGLYLFTACILGSLGLSLVTERLRPRGD